VKSLNNLAKREKILLIAGGGLIFFYLYFSIFLSPINKSITNERKVLESKNAEVASIERLKVSNVSNKKKLDEYVKKFNDAIKQLPKNDRNPEIAYNLNELATKSKITINSVSFGAVSDYASKISTENQSVENKAPISSTVATDTTSQKLKLAPVSIAVVGDYASFLSFVSSIESVQTNNRLVEIGNISISAKSETENIVQANLILNYYFSEGTTKDQPTYDKLQDNNAGKENLFK
jgi:Tfp pilus assembly protein PilO